jgi:hypothetical protein
MSFTFNAVRWIAQREIQYIVPLWGFIPGALKDVKVSNNEIILSFNSHKDNCGEYMLGPPKKNPEIAPKKPKEIHDNDPQNTLK